MPSVSKAQNRAMHAAAEGKSNIGIPEEVGEDFVKADEGKKVGKLPDKITPAKRKAYVKALGK